MKMNSSELDSFVQKFKQLWHSGVDAHLDLHTHAGQAWVHLHVRLGQAPGPLHLHPQPQPQPFSHPKTRSKNSPSRQRRRAKRAAAAQQKQAGEAAREDIVKPTEEVETTEFENIENESEKSTFCEPTEKVRDEFCPDDVYNGEAFRCFQCRMLYIPKSHLDGNPIVAHERCRMHIGVLKCESCAHVLVGLAKIRCHREVCPHSA